MAAKSHNITQLVQFLHNAQPQPQTQEEQEQEPKQKRRNIQKSGSRRVNKGQELFVPSVAHMRSHTTLSSAPLITHSPFPPITLISQSPPRTRCLFRRAVSSSSPASSLRFMLIGRRRARGRRVSARRCGRGGRIRRMHCAFVSR